MKYLIILALLASTAAQAFDYNKTPQQNWNNYLNQHTEHKPRTTSWDAVDKYEQQYTPFKINPPQQRTTANCSVVFGQLRCN